MYLAQGHNVVTPLRLEPTAIRSRVKHSTTEPLRSHMLKLMDKKTFQILDTNSLLIWTYGAFFGSVFFFVPTIYTGLDKQKNSAFRCKYLLTHQF